MKIPQKIMKLKVYSSKRIPLIYKGFQKNSADILPPHRPGLDYEINIKEGVIFKKKRIYPLNPKYKQQADEYVTEMLKKGFIRESK